MANSQNPAVNGATDPLAELKADRSLDIAIHRSTAKAIADVIHICTGCAADGSDSGLDQLDVRTLPALVYAIEWHLEEADKLEEEERQRHEAARGNAKGSAASH
jgi:hypothetical protein